MVFFLKKDVIGDVEDMQASSSSAACEKPIEQIHLEMWKNLNKKKPLRYRCGVQWRQKKRKRRFG